MATILTFSAPAVRGNISLYNYQENFCRNLSESLKRCRKVLGQLATGGGKTVVFSTISYRYAVKSNKSVLILVHRKELLAQTRATLYKMYGINAGIIAAGTRYIAPASVYIGMVESVNNRVDRLQNIGLVIIDECHIAVFNKMHSHFPTQFIVGFSATPLSSSKKFPLNLYYNEIVCGIDIPQLIKGGFLCNNITRAPKSTVDRAALKTKGEEFDENQMSAEFSKANHVNNTVTAYERWAKGTKTIIFNVNVKHSEEVTRAFVEKGYPCKHLDGEHNSGYRKNCLNWFRDTPGAILCNVGILTAGFDEPTIETVMINKATKSMPLWLQMCGRGSRIINEKFIEDKQKEYPYPLELKSIFNIVDMGSNWLAHGDWCDARNWNDMFYNPPKPGEAGVAPVKDCPVCECIVPASTLVCHCLTEQGVECGFIFPVKNKPIEEELNEFIVVTKGIDIVQLINDHKDKREYFALYRYGRQLAEEASKTIPELTEEIINFIVLKYFEEGKRWAKEISEQRVEEGRKRVGFNQWHKDLVKQHLFTELSKYYSQWQQPQVTP